MLGEADHLSGSTNPFTGNVTMDSQKVDRRLAPLRRTQNQKTFRWATHHCTSRMPVIVCRVVVVRYGSIAPPFHQHLVV